MSRHNSHYYRNEWPRNLRLPPRWNFLSCDLISKTASTHAQPLPFVPRCVSLMIHPSKSIVSHHRHHPKRGNALGRPFSSGYLAQRDSLAALGESEGEESPHTMGQSLT